MSVDLGLSPEGKQELALALILWRDFKKSPLGHADWFLAAKNMFDMAQKLGVYKELEDLLTKLPPFDIRPREGY